MGKGPTIRLGTIIDQFHLEVLYGPEGYRDRQISIQDVNRPGLQMTGYFDYFDRERMQLLGLVEWSYLQERTAEERMERFDQLFSYHTPAVIIARAWSRTRSAWGRPRSTTRFCCAPRRIRRIS